MQEWGFIEALERRNSSDRRGRPTPFISKYVFWGGRRRTVRRREERCLYLFVDAYSTKLFIGCLLLIFLSLADAYYTLWLISEDLAEEVNPVMAFYLSLSDATFIINKVLLTMVSIVILCVGRPLWHAKAGFVFATAVYILVVAYELHLLNISFLPF